MNQKQFSFLRSDEVWPLRLACRHVFLPCPSSSWKPALPLHLPPPWAWEPAPCSPSAASASSQQNVLLIHINTKTDDADCCSHPQITFPSLAFHNVFSTFGARLDRMEGDTNILLCCNSSAGSNQGNPVWNEQLLNETNIRKGCTTTQYLWESLSSFQHSSPEPGLSAFWTPRSSAGSYPCGIPRTQKDLPWFSPEAEPNVTIVISDLWATFGCHMISVMVPINISESNNLTQ